MFAQFDDSIGYVSITLGFSIHSSFWRSRNRKNVYNKVLSRGRRGKRRKEDQLQPPKTVGSSSSLYLNPQAWIKSVYHDRSTALAPPWGNFLGPTHRMDAVESAFLNSNWWRIGLRLWMTAPRRRWAAVHRCLGWGLLMPRCISAPDVNDIDLYTFGPLFSLLTVIIISWSICKFASTV